MTINVIYNLYVTFDGASVFWTFEAVTLTSSEKNGILCEKKPVFLKLKKGTKKQLTIFAKNVFYTELLVRKISYECEKIKIDIKYRYRENRFFSRKLSLQN